MADDYEQVPVESRDGWRAWLTAHHDSSPGAWAVTWKKASGHPHVSAAEISEEALAFGWIDSRPRALDAQRSMLLVTPRKPGSAWSRVNKSRVASLTAEGRMTPAGAAAVARAKQDGTWNALDAVEDLVIPDDLAAAFDAHPPARRHWEAFPRSTKRAILEWITTAKKAETRARRVAETAEKAQDNVRANQWRPPAA